MRRVKDSLASSTAAAVLALAVLALAGLASSGVAEPLVAAPYKPGGIYALGEKVGWTLRPATGDASSATLYSYAVRKNNQVVLKEGQLDLRQPPAALEVAIDEPAMVLVELKPADPAAKPQLLGAAVAPEKIGPSLPEPADFDAFWAAKIKALMAVPPNPVLTPGPSDKPDVEYFTLKMDHVDGKHVFGQMARPKREGKFPGLVIFQWASPPYALQPPWVTERAAEGWLVVNVQPHDVLPTEPKSYYDALPEEIKKYNTIGRDDRDKSYFLQMYLADYRAVEYLASREDWDGKTLVVTGTSMGGQQSLCTAALNPKVTGLVVHVPSGADANGPLHGRASGYPNWPADDPKVMKAAPYFDTVNCAARIRVPSLVSMGFLDVTSPPVGIWAAYNQIRGPKEVVPLVEAPHNHLATPEQQAAYTTRAAEWMRTLVAGRDIFEPADKPSPRTDENSRIAHEQLLRKKGQGKIDLYFLGDSITRRWGATDERYKDLLAHWKKSFHGWNAANFGWGADRTQNILWRIENGELQGVNPKVIVLMAGTNNVGRATPIGDDAARIADVTRGIQAIVEACRKAAPRATILLFGITPRNDNLAVMPTIRSINANLARLADGKSVRYLSLDDRLADASGRLLPGMTDPDQLHLSVRAYEAWADVLSPVLTELLGPRKKVDHAPPPTGDPSASRAVAVQR